MLEALAEEAGDAAYNAQIEMSLFPATIGPFLAPVVRIEPPTYLTPQQAQLFHKEVA